MTGSAWYFNRHRDELLIYEPSLGKG
jgi:hypothetical protein